MIFDLGKMQKTVTNKTARNVRFSFITISQCICRLPWHTFWKSKMAASLLLHLLPSEFLCFILNTSSIMITYTCTREHLLPLCYTGIYIDSGKYSVWPYKILYTRQTTEWNSILIITIANEAEGGNVFTSPCGVCVCVCVSVCMTVFN